MRVNKPGHGWKHLGSAVWELPSGLRIGISGACRFPDGTFVWGNSWPQSVALDRFIAMAGGNKRRGVMAWARQLMQEGTAT